MGWVLLVGATLWIGVGCEPESDGFGQGDDDIGDDDATGDDDTGDDDTTTADDDTTAGDDDATVGDDDATGDDDDATGDDDVTGDDDATGDDDTTIGDGPIEGTVDEGQESPGGPPPWTICVDAFDEADWLPQGGPQDLPVASATLTASSLPISYALTYTMGAPVRVWAFVDEDGSGCATGPGNLEPMGVYPGSVTVPASGVDVELDVLHSH